MKESSSKEDGINSENVILNLESTMAKEALAKNLLDKEYPTGWKRPKLPQYKGESDPIDHIHKFLANMEDVTNRKDLWCRMFRSKNLRKGCNELVRKPPPG